MLYPVFQNHRHPPILGCLLVTSTSHWVSVPSPGGGGLNWVLSNRAKFYKHSHGWDAVERERLFTSSNSRLLVNLYMTLKHGPVGDEWVLT